MRKIPRTISSESANVPETKSVMERSIGKTFKDSRYLNTSCLFYIHVRIFTQIYVFLKNSTWYNWLFTSYWSNIKITFYTCYHTFSDAERALLLFLVKFGGLELKNLYEIADIELLNSNETIRELYKTVITQNEDFQIDNWKNKKEVQGLQAFAFPVETVKDEHAKSRFKRKLRGQT